MARKSRIPEYNKIPMRKKIGVDVGIYARLSVEDEDSAISESIENQISQAKTKIENDSAAKKVFSIKTFFIKAPVAACLILCLLIGTVAYIAMKQRSVIV